MSFVDFAAVTVGYVFLGLVLIACAIVVCLAVEDALDRRRARRGTAVTAPLPRLTVVPDWDAEMAALVQDFRGDAA